MMVAQAAPAQCKAVTQALIRNGTWLDPTLVVMHYYRAPHEQDTPNDTSSFGTYDADQQALLRLLHSQGLVKLLAGTDAPIFVSGMAQVPMFQDSIWEFHPGLSLLEELVLLRRGTKHRSPFRPRRFHVVAGLMRALFGSASLLATIAHGQVPTVPAAGNIDASPAVVTVPGPADQARLSVRPHEMATGTRNARAGERILPSLDSAIDSALKLVLREYAIDPEKIGEVGDMWNASFDVAEQAEAYRVALLSALATSQTSDNKAGLVVAGSPLEKNIAFVNSHQTELEALDRIGMWDIP